ncbi:hypothetical protein B0A52_06453 [Exophiala mesophila]|uniref:Filamentation protein n=1 Tax=Exophiala mesophila TaxID=212818 RepID=A0A438N251_EXOME|nr:hypothetical protein B0A52_06453 [Exophiala mesophila]
MVVVHHDHEKASRYIEHLDSARTSTTWSEVPELIRKVSKHAPNRKCLIQAAKLDLETSSYISKTRRPGTAEATQSSPESLASSLANELLAVDHDEDKFQAYGAILWGRWSFAQEKSGPLIDWSFDPPRAAADANSVWTKICVLKSVYIQGMLLRQTGESNKSQQLHQSLLPWLDSNRSLVVSTSQLLYWAQQLLAQVALSTSISPPNTMVFDESSSFRLQAFRHWAILAAKSSPVKNTTALASTYGNTAGHTSDLTLWRAYFQFLSGILHRQPGASKNVAITPRDLAVELRRVETSYESELLRHHQFPKADESNGPIEAWVEEVVSNWRVMCGSGWSEADLGEGGRNSVSRNVLDILYRAATKTFHSTLILRRLFQVHKSVTDFDLSYKALDTYIQLMDKGRARAAKSTEMVTAQDDDQTYIETIAEGIEGLCSFGGRDEAEKAFDLTTKLEDLLDELEPESPDATPNGLAPVKDEINGVASTSVSLSPEALDTAYRAVGIGKAQWAHWTPYGEQRSSLQSEAIEALQKAARQNIPIEQHLGTFYALARLLAETREVAQAIAVVKTALASGRSGNGEPVSYTTQRNLISFWHLLSLLLTSRQDFATAAQSCAAAVEQFSPPQILFGNSSGNSSNVGNKGGQSGLKAGLVDDMECSELQSLIEIRITELSLTEVNEGPEHAVNSSNDLLALYLRLFGRFGEVGGPVNVSKSKLSQPPRSSAGTVKSSRASMFSRKRDVHSNETARALKDSSLAEENARPNTQATTSTHAPTIQVTSNDDAPSPHKHRLFRSSHELKRHEKRTSSGNTPAGDTRRRLSRSGSRGRQVEKSPSRELATAGGAHKKEAAKPPPSTENNLPEVQNITSDQVPAIPASTDHDSSENAKQKLNAVPHNLAAHDEVPEPAKHEHQPPEQDIRLPEGEASTFESRLVTRFPKSAKQRHAMSILVKIWLTVAMLYRRSKMFEDSREACDEAAKIAQKIETMIASRESSGRAFSEAEWGAGGKSSDELWADVYCERGELLVAIALEAEEKEGRAISEGMRGAVDQYEQCLMYFNNHAGGIVGLSNILLDYYERKVELAKKVDGGKTEGGTHRRLSIDDGFGDDKFRPQHRRNLSRMSEDVPINGASDIRGGDFHSNAHHLSKDEELKKTPENLNRLAARDRAYGLLTTLTKLGSGWDNSEAWLALARAHELGGEVDKAKEILWWCVELEDSRPVRHWRNLGGGYVL